MPIYTLDNLLKPTELLARNNGDIVVAAHQSPGASNLPDVLTSGIKEGYTRENLLRQIIQLSFDETTPLLTEVLPRTAGTAADITRRWPELIFDATLPAKIGERGRAPLVTHRIVERKATIDRFGLAYDTTMFAGDQTFGDTETYLVYLIAFVVKQMESAFQMNALQALQNVDEDDERGLYRGRQDIGKSIEEVYEERNKIFAMFDKNLARGLNVLLDIRLHINRQLTIIGGTKANTILVRDTLSQRLVAQNTNITQYDKAGPAGPPRIKTSVELLNEDMFMTLGAGTDQGYMILPIKDTTAMLNIFGGSLMTRETVIGQYYPFYDRVEQWGSGNWKQSFETVHIYDASQKTTVPITKRQALEQSGCFGPDGKPLKFTPGVRSSQFRDENGLNLDMFQDEDGDLYKYFGDWSEKHMSISQLNRWVKQVITQLSKQQKNLIDAAKDGLITDFNGYDASGLKQTLLPIFPMAIAQIGDSDNLKAILASGPKFLARDVTEVTEVELGARGITRLLLQQIMTLLINASKYVTFSQFNGGNPTNIGKMVQLSVFTDEQLNLLSKVAAYGRFVPIAPKTILNFGQFQGDVDRIAALRPDLRDAVNSIKQNFDTIFANAIAKIRSVAQAEIARANQANPGVAPTSAEWIAAFRDNIAPSDRFATDGFVLKTYEEMLQKNRNWPGTAWEPMSLSNPDIPMTPDDLAAFVAKHGAIFVHTPGTTRGLTINSRMSALSPHIYGEHFSRMNQDPQYRDTFMASTTKMDQQLKNFFTDNEMIEAAVGTKWREYQQVPNTNAPNTPEDFISQILRATATNFADNWNTVSSKFTGLEQIIAKLFLLSPINMDTIDDWYRNEIPLPFSTFIIADHMWFEAEQMIACARGAADLGMFMVTDYRFTRSDDGKIQTTAGTLAAHAGVLFVNKRNVVNLQDVKLIRALRGCGTKLLTPDQRLSGQFTLAEGICFHIAPLGTNLPGAWSTAGSADNDPYLRSKSCRPEPSIPCAARLFETMGMERFLDNASMEGYKINTVVHRGKVVITDDGYTFNNVRPGCSALGHLDGPFDADSPLLIAARN